MWGGELWVKSLGLLGVVEEEVSGQWSAVIGLFLMKPLLHRSWDILSQSVHGASCSMIEHGRVMRPRGADLSPQALMWARCPRSFVERSVVNGQRSLGKRKRWGQRSIVKSHWERMKKRLLSRQGPLSLKVRSLS
jgi:hypothetical protein